MLYEAIFGNAQRMTDFTRIFSNVSESEKITWDSVQHWRKKCTPNKRQLCFH